MNKTAIKNYAIWARNKLIADIEYKAGLLGVTDKGAALPLSQSTGDVEFFDIGTKDYADVRGEDIRRRRAFIAAIQDKAREGSWSSAFHFIVEKIAYTWFNRLAAIRFMEVNNYLPSNVRVLSSKNEKKAEPDMVTRPFDTDLSFTQEEQDYIMLLKDENKLDALFRWLFVRQCRKMQGVLPRLFAPMDDYMELLLTISFTDKDGVLWHLVHDVSEDDFNVEKEGQVEIIGWLYQYYNTEPKDKVFADLKKNIKVSKDKIPAATQLFTPDWIVRYMVENSLGRLWMEGHPNEGLKKTWKYYLEEASQEPQVQAQLAGLRKDYAAIRPDNIKIIDPCMGSGHILVYAFDVLMQIYESQGWTRRDAARCIVENNLYGLDIDDRAAQLAYFAVMMKAMQYDHGFLGRGVKPHIFAISESNDIRIPDDVQLGQETAVAQKLISEMKDAKVYGSILNPSVSQEDLAALRRRISTICESASSGKLWDIDAANKVVDTLFPILDVAELLVQKYDIAITNPPYMGSRSMNAKLSEYTQKYYNEAKSDLYSVFIERCWKLVDEGRFVAMITMHTFMFLSSFEQLREQYLKFNLISMVHMGIKAFDEIGNDVVQTTAFIQRNATIDNYNTQFCRLVDFKDQKIKEVAFLKRENLFPARVSSFFKIPGYTMAYWVPQAFVYSFSLAPALDKFIYISALNKTGNNDKYLRYWWEIKDNAIGCKWRFYSKGGNFRRYYGNIDTVIDWSDSARAFYKNNPTSNLINEKYWYKEGITYSAVTSRGTGFRYLPEGCLYDMGGPAIFVKKDLYIILALLNSSVASFYFSVLNPSINLQTKDIRLLPALIDNSEEAGNMALQNVQIAKKDWDRYETSVDFSGVELVGVSLKDAYSAYVTSCEADAATFEYNLKQINHFFAAKYGLDESILVPLEPRDNAISIETAHAWIIRFISYAVGCMFGRFSLDSPGVCFAGASWDYNKYIRFIPDADNCIPITDEPYFEDDIVGRFVELLKIVYGERSLEENLQFVASALGGKGNSSRDVIRRYFLNDFYKDHVKVYQKRPIYWLFDSGKQNGFKALVYMHRWNADTVGNLRVEYLHRMQLVYEKEIERMQDTEANSEDSREIAQAVKRREKLVKQLKEAREYDTHLAHVALSRVAIDLDDGVKVNYEKVQKGPDGKSLDILAKM